MTVYQPREVLLIDNASSDGSVEIALKQFPWLQIIRNERNLGFAGGCNVGFQHANGKYILILNNDTKFEGDWLDRMVEVMESDERIAACQPKILSLKNPETFDYAGAAGGMIDIFGYPFARGRIFFTLEKDERQYDTPAEIFWASGTATLLRKSVLQQSGLFDEDFFAHMEEIDLNWRFHLLGYRVVAVPQAVVYHQGGGTLSESNPFKMYLNHRNSLIMLLKNYSLANLLWIFPIRFLLEFLTFFYTLINLDLARMRALPKALGFILINCGKILQKRRGVQKIRQISDSQILDKMYRNSIVFAYFIRRIRRFQDLNFEIK